MTENILFCSKPSEMFWLHQKEIKGGWGHVMESDKAGFIYVVKQI